MSVPTPAVLWAVECEDDPGLHGHSLRFFRFFPEAGRPALCSDYVSDGNLPAIFLLGFRRYGQSTVCCCVSFAESVKSCTALAPLNGGSGAMNEVKADPEKILAPVALSLSYSDFVLNNSRNGARISPLDHRSHRDSLLDSPWVVSVEPCPPTSSTLRTPSRGCSARPRIVDPIDQSEPEDAGQVRAALERALIKSRFRLVPQPRFLKRNASSCFSLRIFRLRASNGNSP